jgi:hypothetical protein
MDLNISEEERHLLAADDRWTADGRNNSNGDGVGM